jgi:hypothetical protein
MPAKPAWLLRIPEIVQALQALTVPVVDRLMFERLFGVRRRRAITLMQEFGAYQSGRTLLVERGAMIRRLELLQEGEEFEVERERKQKLQDSLDQLHRHRTAAKVIIPVLSSELRKQLPQLPSGVHVRDRELAIEYNNVVELLQRLYELSQAAATDFEGFTTVIEASRSAASQCTQSRPEFTGVIGRESF